MAIFTWTFLLETLVGGIISNRVDAGVVGAFSADWKRVIQGLNAPDLQATRDELAMAVSRSFLWAQQSLVQECLHEVAQDLDGGFRQPVALPGHEAAVDWLNRKDQQLRSDLKQLEKGQLNALAAADTSSLGNLLQSQDVAMAFSQQLTTVVVQEQAPDIYGSRAAASDTGLMARLAAYFEFELQTNQTVQSWFQTRLLLQINHQLQSVDQSPLTLENLENALKVLTSRIPKIIGQLNNLVSAVNDLGSDANKIRTLVTAQADQLALLVLRNGDELAELKRLLGDLLTATTSNQINNLDDDFLQLLRQKCLKRIQSEDQKTQLFIKQKLELESVYVPAFLNRTCKQQRIHKNERQQKLSISEAIKKRSHITIIGPPGIGKSTILKSILTIEYQKNLSLEGNCLMLPVLIRLREVADNGGTFNIRQELGNIWGITLEHVNLVLRTGNVLLLLDGLDEIQKDFRERVCTEVNSLSNSCAKNQIVLTCRNSLIPNLAESFVLLEVADLDKKQQEKFITNYFSLALQDSNSYLGQIIQGHEEISGTKLIWEIQSSTRLQELAQSPLLLSMICLVYISTGTLPEKRSKIYEQGVKIYLKIWDEYRVSYSRHQSEAYRKLGFYAKHQLLEDLAYRKFIKESKYTQFSEEEIVSLIAKHEKVTLDEGYEILVGLSTDHGLLARTSLEQWEFSHLTFHEFFVAKWILNHDEQDLLTSKILEERWQEVIRLVTELKPPSLTWFIKTKAHVDSLIASEDSLQALLQIINNKVQSLANSEHAHSYKQGAVRAFYYELGLNFSDKNMTNYLHQSSYYDLAHAIDIKLSDALEAQYEMDFVQDPYHDAFNLQQQIDYELFLHYEDYDYVYSTNSDKIAQIEKLKAEADKLYKKHRDMSRELHPDLLYDSNILEMIFSLSYSVKSRKFKRNSNFSATSGIFSRCSDYPCNPYHIGLSQYLKERLSILLDKYFCLSSESELESWLEDFLILIREERKIGHVFNFLDEQRMLADRYYKANLYFIELINIPDATTLNERAILEDDILKPVEKLRDEYPEFY